MLDDYLRTARYVRNWKSRGGAVADEISIDRDGTAVDATLYMPPTRRGRIPGWVAIGGVSRMGRFHPQLTRFCESLAASGAAVLVPEIPEWSALSASPRVVEPTLRASIAALRKRPEVRPEGLGTIGFSFGAASLAIATSDERNSGHLSGTVLFGGYCCLERTVGCFLTGRHEWQGADYNLSPDPYGRWVVAGNYLTEIDGLEDAGDVADALLTLAGAASGQRISAWDPRHDEMILALREALPAERRTLFDCFATASTADRPERAGCADIARRLAAACRRVDPLLEPREGLAGVTVPTQVIHGHADRLIPFTEGLRLLDGLRPEARRGITVTRLFSHKEEDTRLGFGEFVTEQMTLLGALRRMIGTTTGGATATA